MCERGAGAGDDPLPKRLAAILAVDMVDYTGQMARDEAATIARLRLFRRDVIAPAVAAYGGRIFKTTGDGVLVEFRSAVAAVECAARIQAPRRLVAEGTEPEPIRVRIGIGLGEVTVDGDDLLGASVNLACRLEAHAESGGVCVARAVFDNARMASTVNFAPLGPVAVKGLDAPVEVWRLAPEADDPTPIGPGPALSSRQGPSVAVAPFENTGGDPDQEYLVDGMVEEIVASLSRVHWLTVIARQSSMRVRDRAFDLRAFGRDLGARYVVTGSVRRAGDRLRISTQFVEAATGAQLWSKRFDAAPFDVFDLQDEIAAEVAGAIEPSLRKAEIGRVRRRPPDDRDAYDFYLRALACMYEVTPEAREMALSFANRALALDPGYPEAHGVASWLYFARALWEGNAPEAFREGAIVHARAVQISRTDDATTLAHAAIAIALATHEYAEPRDMIDKAIAANPSSAHAHGHGAVIATWAGDYDRAVAFAERALRLSPFDPLGVMPHAAVAGARLMMDQHEAALEAARRALQVYPTHAPAYQISICALVRLGRIEDARKTAARFMALYPKYLIRPHAPVFEHFGRELRAAGLPAA